MKKLRNTEDWMEKAFRKHDESLYRTKMLRPNFEDAYKKTRDDNALIHGLKKLDDGK
jgi:hypothetical protein